MVYTEFTEPNVCMDENMTTDAAGQPQFEPWAVPRPVVDLKVQSGGDGRLIKPEISLPGKRLISQKFSWLNDTPIEQPVLIRVTRASRSILTSNPNAIQVRDKWNYAIDNNPEEPITTTVHDGQFGGAIDLGSNSVAEPVPGRLWLWSDTCTVDKWVTPLLKPTQTVNVWYQCYVWTPPPWSNNANKNSPQHEVYVNWVRLQLIVHPMQGNVVVG